MSSIAQSVSALDFNFEQAVGGLILTAGRKVESEKFECNNLGYKLTGLTWWPWRTGEVLFRDSWDLYLWGQHDH